MTERSSPPEHSEEASTDDAGRTTDTESETQARATEDEDRDEPWADDPAETTDDPSLSGIFGGNPGDTPERTAIVPGDPSIENALFVVLGVLVSVFVLYRVWAVFVP